MKLWKVRPDEHLLRAYDIEGRHEWKLPGVRCTSCGNTWTTVGLEYPGVDLSEMETAKLYISGVVPVDQFEELRKGLVTYLRREMCLRPGTSLGPYHGKGSGVFPDLGFSHPWTMFMKESALSALKQSGLSLFGVLARLKVKGKRSIDLLELQVEPYGRLAKSSLPPEGVPTCAGCGRRGFEVPEMFAVEKESLPKDVDLFRLADAPAYILGTDRFVEVVKKLRLTGAVFEPVNVDPS